MTEKSIAQIVQKRVGQGTIYLNENYPGWVDKIKVDTLDISCHLYCMLGQLEGSYGKGLKSLGSNGGTLLGFEGDDLLINEELTDEWIQTILRLRAEKIVNELKQAA